MRVGMQYGGLVASLLIVALWVFNAFCKITYLFRFSWVAIERGRMTVGWHSGKPYRSSGLRAQFKFEWPTLLTPEYHSIPSGAWVTVPLWIPLLTFAAVAFVAWRSHRNRPPCVCLKCEYDLTGNVSGVCPECGESLRSRGGAGNCE